MWGEMILVGNLRIFMLAVGLCVIRWNNHSQAQTLICATSNITEPCADDTKTPYCAVDTNIGNPIGCVNSIDCPLVDTPEVSCENEKDFCCCKAVTSGACNDLLNNRTLKDKACQLVPLKDLEECAAELFCHDDTDMPMLKKCQPGEFCGARKDNGKEMGCVRRSRCHPNTTSDITCDEYRQMCCCNTDNCNTRAKVCEATDDVPGCPPKPKPTPTTLLPPPPPPPPAGGSGANVTLSVGSLVALTLITCFCHWIEA